MDNSETCVADPKQYPDATASLTEAFLEDPVLSYLFEDEEHRPLLQSAFLQTVWRLDPTLTCCYFLLDMKNWLLLYGRNLKKILKTILLTQELSLPQLLC